MSTRVTGIPTLTGSPELKLLIEYDVPWQGSTQGLSAKAYRATWDYGTSRWMDSGGAELSIPIPRVGVNDPGLRGQLRAYLTVTYSGAQPKTGEILLAGYETSPGVLDLTVDPAPVTWIAAASLTDLINQATALVGAAGFIPWSTGDHTTIPSAPGYYRIIGGTESGQIWQRTSGTLVRHPELEGTTAGQGTLLGQPSAVIDATSRSLVSVPTGTNYAAIQITGCTIAARYDSTPATGGVSDQRYAPGGLLELTSAAEIAGFTYIGINGTGTLAIVYRSS